jgi:hypothetical protein
MTLPDLSLSQILGAAIATGIVSAVDRWLVEPLRTKRMATEAGRAGGEAAVTAHERRCPGAQLLQPVGADLARD